MDVEAAVEDLISEEKEAIRACVRGLVRDLGYVESFDCDRYVSSLESAIDHVRELRTLLRIREMAAAEDRQKKEGAR